jgi:hypothetical protein
MSSLSMCVIKILKLPSGVLNISLLERKNNIVNEIACDSQKIVSMETRTYRS